MCQIGKYCIPQQRKCCFFLPLKKGLIAWGYFKLVFHIILMFYGLMLVIRFKQLSLDGSWLIVTLFIFILIDIIMNVIFLKSIQQDNYELMTNYFYYIVTLLVLYAIVFIIFTIIKMIRDGDFFYNWPYMLQDCVIGCGNFALQFYFSELVKCHIRNLKGFDLENQSSYEGEEVYGEEGKEDHEEEKKKRDKDHDTDDTDDTDDSSSDDSDKGNNEHNETDEEVTPSQDNQEIELTEMNEMNEMSDMNEMNERNERN